MKNAITYSIIIGISIFATPLIAQKSPTSCADLEADASSGLYVFDVADHGPMQVFCDNEIVADGRRGGWMLAWSNLRGGGGDPVTDMSWWSSINTPPRFNGVLPLSGQQEQRQFFEVFVGLGWWVKLAEADSAAEMVYEWAGNYSPKRRIDQQAFCPFRLDPTASYTIHFDPALCRQTIGQAGLPGLFTSHSGIKWSTADVDNDSHAENCSEFYSRTPFWYAACVSGSINGSGELHTVKHENGAHWHRSQSAYAASQPATSALGAGSGWIYIRPADAGQ